MGLKNSESPVGLQLFILNCNASRIATKNVNTKITNLNIRDELTERNDLLHISRLIKSRAVGVEQAYTKS